MRIRALVAPVALALVTIGLTGCQPGLLAPADDEHVPGLQDPSATPEPSASEGEPEEPPTQSPLGGGDALDVTCEEVLTLDQLYDFDPNFTPTDEAARDLPPVFETIADADGIVCAFTHVTAEQMLLVGVAPSGTELGDDEGYTNEVGIGTVAEEFGGYVVAVGSTYFGDPSDAEGLVETVSLNMPDPGE
ncbi:hypothetical protein [uncultured Agrococcus sp.]|uniref:hypothetical protein n=1 Tax=uncultured Agrococcus sp. TaxID=382258 RepID=UPI0025EA63BA|nr:hypothetical protein [uncultured Agrococcus sp.]